MTDSGKKIFAPSVVYLRIIQKMIFSVPQQILTRGEVGEPGKERGALENKYYIFITKLYYQVSIGYIFYMIYRYNEKRRG